MTIPSINKHFILLMIIAGFISAVSSWMVSQKYTEAQVVDLRAKLEHRARSFKTNLSLELSKLDMITDLLARNSLLTRFVENPADKGLGKSTNILLAENNARLNASAIFLMDEKGQTLAASNYLSEKSFVGKNYAFRPYFQQAIDHSVGRFLAIGVTSDELGYYVSQAIEQNGKVVGVVVLKARLTHMRSFVEGLDGDFLVGDENGVIFLSSNPSLELYTLYSLTDKARDFIKATRQYPLEKIRPLPLKTANYQFDNKATIFLDAGTYNGNYLVDQSRLGEFGWTVLILGELETVISRMYILMAASFIGLFSLFAALLYFIKTWQRRQAFQDVLENIPTAVSWFGNDLELVTCNSQFKDLFNFPARLFAKGKPTFKTLVQHNLVNGEYGDLDEQKFWRDMEERLNRREDHAFERERPDGTVLDIRGKWLSDGGFLTLYTDVTERIENKEEVEDLHRFVKAMLEAMEIGVVIVDEDLDIIHSNSRFYELLDLPVSLSGKERVNYEEIFRYNAQRGEYGPGDLEAHVQQRMRTYKRFKPHHFERVGSNGLVLDVIGKPLTHDGQLIGFMSLYRDITSVEYVSGGVDRSVRKDELTGLMLQVDFRRELALSFEKDQHLHRQQGLILLDLDDFMDFNNRYGYENGNKIISRCAEVCRSHLGEGDIVARYNGEEFALLLNGWDQKRVVSMAKTLVDEIAAIQFTTVDGDIAHITACAGVTVRQPEDTADSFFQRADTALNTAKNKATNLVQVG